MANLTDDLTEIRKQSGLSPMDVFEKSRVPLSVVKEIENGSVFDKPEKQTTYIRSFIRAYSKVVGISDEDSIIALDAHYDGNYDGFLVEKYKDTAKVKPSGSKVRSEEDKFRMVTTTLGAPEYSRPDPSRPYNQKTPPPPEITSINWADMGKKFAGFRTSSSLFLFISVLIVLAVAALFYFGVFENLMGGQSEQAAIQEELSSPSEFTSSAETLPIESVLLVPETRLSPLSDTLYLVVYAYLDKLEPIRVRSDINNILSPYWVEQGEAMRFEFLDEINLRGQYSRMALLFNGHLIDNFQRLAGPDGVVRISRQYLENESRYRSSTPGALPANMPEPGIIRNRPIF